ncbi:MAG: response regulator [Nitrospirae bacterium]|uniref:Response regulator receiver protein n=1 Tax=uncultured Nitrospirota bacterium TaxID=170969 RepID=A0A142BTY6_9BACT|nr:response regulator receiver protein [uncultured Nitrospirota bacterium]MBF0343171.1 response regulator [Nitrospirota bacterium]
MKTDKAKTVILCVDDEQDILDSLHDTFMDTYDVRTAINGADALKIVRGENIAVIISDQRMPVMTGSEFLAEVNKIKPKVKKILLTGYSDINAAIDAINKGSVNSYIHKPWDDSHLIKTVENLVNLYNADMFANNMLTESMDIKAKIDQWKYQLELLEKFIESCTMSACVLDKKEKIVYMNKKGLGLLKYSNIRDVKNKELKSVFIINDNKKKEFRELYEKGGISNLSLDAKCSDGQIAGMQASLTFIDDHVIGVFFNLPNSRL